MEFETKPKKNLQVTAETEGFFGGSALKNLPANAGD